MTDSLSDLMSPTLEEFGFDGRDALEAVIASSGYRTTLHAVALLTVFSHPDTVAQTAGKSILNIVRNVARRGEVVDQGERKIGFDDNKAPTDVFMWCNGWRRRPRDLQFNHVYDNSQDPECYTSLANLCVTPSFLAKLTDTDKVVKELLRYRVWDIYGWHPSGTEKPIEPIRYSEMTWAPFLSPVKDVRALLTETMARRANDRTTRMAKVLGINI